MDDIYRVPGRPKAPGKYYRFGLRFRPGIDPAELGKLLELISNAAPEKRPVILRAALMGGTAQANEAADSEVTETVSIIDDLFGDF